MMRTGSGIAKGGFIALSTLAPLIATAAPYIIKGIGKLVGKAREFFKARRGRGISPGTDVVQMLAKALKRDGKSGRFMARGPKTAYHVGARVAKVVLRKILAHDPESAKRGGIIVNKMLQRLIHIPKDAIVMPASNPMHPRLADVLAPLLSHPSLRASRPRIVAALATRRLQAPTSGSGIIETIVAALETLRGKKALRDVFNMAKPYAEKALQFLGRTLFRRASGREWRSAEDLEGEAEAKTRKILEGQELIGQIKTPEQREEERRELERGSQKSLLDDAASMSDEKTERALRHNKSHPETKDEKRARKAVEKAYRERMAAKLVEKLPKAPPSKLDTEVLGVASDGPNRTAPAEAVKPAENLNPAAAGLTGRSVGPAPAMGPISAGRYTADAYRYRAYKIINQMRAKKR